MARTDMGISPCPVIKIIGMWISAPANSRWKSSPPIPGSLISRTRQLAISGRLLLMNSDADPNISTCRPTDSTRRLMARQTDGSSSTTKTMGTGSVMKHRWSGWESELEQRSVGNWNDRQFSAVGLNDGTADGEPHPDSFRLRGKEWFEDAVGQLRLDSWTRILNLDQSTVWVPCRPDEKFPRPACGRTHCFNSIHNQVNENLL